MEINAYNVSGRSYDYVYLTNTPSFYKLNLCDQLGARGLKGLLVLYGFGGEAVNASLRDGERRFDWCFLHSGDTHRRSHWSTLMSLLKIMRKVRARHVIFSGWAALEYNLYSLLSPRRKNLMVVESTIVESATGGLKGWIKKRVVGRMSGALPCGTPHGELLEALGFRGKLAPTGSVGVLNTPGREKLPHHCHADGVRYLYVGRLTGCKNLDWIIEQFNRSGRRLTIVGDGEMKDQLHAMAAENVEFVGFVDNARLGDVYRDHDVMLLGSSSETWGMVVEEAIYFGLPVIVSDRVGCRKDMVEDLGAGLVFRFDDSEDFEAKCVEIERNYSKFAEAVARVDFDERIQRQIDAYNSLIR